MLPFRAGGLNIVNIKLWNRAAICKMLWSLNQKKDRCWIKWIHGYYIKNQIIFHMDLPRQCSWVIKKILGARDYVKNLPDGTGIIQKSEFSIREVYKALQGNHVIQPWTKLICQNAALAKYTFTSWLLMHDKTGYL